MIHDRLSDSILDEQVQKYKLFFSLGSGEFRSFSIHSTNNLVFDLLGLGSKQKRKYPDLQEAYRLVSSYWTKNFILFYYFAFNCFLMLYVMLWSVTSVS